jgi:hypothetical protein
MLTVLFADAPVDEPAAAPGLFAVPFEELTW